MKKLLSLPPNLVDSFHDITGLDKSEWYCTNDPVDHKLGSGGGTAWLLKQCHDAWGPDVPMDEWISQEARILLHAGGQSRRLPAYAPVGKVLTPIPVFRWERGQRIGQNLLTVQMPLYEKMMRMAPKNVHTLIVNGDVFIRSTLPLQPLPEADVICYALWVEPEIAKDHGVYVMKRSNASELEFMLQKPSLEKLGELMIDHLSMMDIGVWMLSDKAVGLLMKKCNSHGDIKPYDLYSEFGCSLGTNPAIKDDELNKLKVAILPLPGGEFYHYGTSHELISSSLSLQNLVNDQRQIMHRYVKPHPSIFIQDAECASRLTEDNHQVWIDNSYVGKGWTLTKRNIITGIPQNDWTVSVKEGLCLDMVPMGDREYAIRPYGFDDKMRGRLDDMHTTYQEIPFVKWAKDRQISIGGIEHAEDLQSAKIYPLTDNMQDAYRLLCWMTCLPEDAEAGQLWRISRKVSADEISARANLRRLNAQRNQLRAISLNCLQKNESKSIFAQLDMADVAKELVKTSSPSPTVPMDEKVPILKRMSYCMLHSEYHKLTGKPYKEEEQQSFELLREGLVSTLSNDKQNPRMTVYRDQIVWARCPVRIDIAGGWTDTPPYCLMEGGNVVNLAIELNGQPPIQTYVRPCKEPYIILRSIDLGASETIRTFDELSKFTKVGSPFSIPKAALALSGFLPEYCSEHYHSLQQQLETIGCGVELTLLSAIPAGSGLGTSSVLAANVLGALSDFCGLGWDKTEIGRRTLVLEQLLTTGGGWQDQIGGIMQGVKLLQTKAGADQTPVVRWLPDELFTQAEYQKCHLLYYTGITRTAKTLLNEIVRNMFLNENSQLRLLREMKQQALDMYDAIQCTDFGRMGGLVRSTWQQNQSIDADSNPAAVRHITEMVDDYCLGYKLAGAGGGGYLYLVAKDMEAAANVRRILNDNRPNDCARFVDMTLSKKGLQVSRS
jgi:galactokinase/mevalonate kinase-like predicted kinase